MAAMQTWVRVKKGQKDPLGLGGGSPCSELKYFFEICTNETYAKDLLLYQISALVLNSFMLR